MKLTGSWRVLKPDMSPRSYQNQHLVSGQLPKTRYFDSCRLEPAIWSRDTGQQIPCFDRCQLLITWMSNIKKVHGKPRLHVSINLLFGVWPPCCATPPSPSPSSCVRAHEQNRCPWQPWENQFMGFIFPIWLWGSAWCPFGPPELCYNSWSIEHRWKNTLIRIFTKNLNSFFLHTFSGSVVFNVPPCANLYLDLRHSVFTVIHSFIGRTNAVGDFHWSRARQQHMFQKERTHYVIIT